MRELIDHGEGFLECPKCGAEVYCSNDEGNKMSGFVSIAIVNGTKYTMMGECPVDEDGGMQDAAYDLYDYLFGIERIDPDTPRDSDDKAQDYMYSWTANNIEQAWRSGSQVVATYHSQNVPGVQIGFAFEPVPHTIRNLLQQWAMPLDIIASWDDSEWLDWPAESACGEMAGQLLQAYAALRNKMTPDASVTSFKDVRWELADAVMQQIQVYCES